MRIARLGRGFGPVVRQTIKWMNEVTFLLHTVKVTGLRVLAGTGAFHFLIIFRPNLWPTHTSV
jgi:hypothetical protein